VSGNQNPIDHTVLPMTEPDYPPITEVDAHGQPPGCPWGKPAPGRGAGPGVHPMGALQLSRDPPHIREQPRRVVSARCHYCVNRPTANASSPQLQSMTTEPTPGDENGRSTTRRVRSCTDGTGQAARARPARVRTHGPRRDDNGIGGTKREGRSVTRDWGPWLVGGGLLLLVGGLLAWTGALSWLGNLPGDIRISSGNTRIYIPITSMVLVSVALNVLLWLFLSLFHR
jgi:hypothetical protein